MNARPLLTGPSLYPADGDPKQIVVFLHGYGFNGADLLSIAPHWRKSLPEALFVAPDAPEEAPAGVGGRQWWGVSSFNRAAFVAGAANAAPMLDAFLDDLLAKHALTEDRMALVGFSQGAMMALHVGPSRPKALAGIIAYSGMLADPAGLESSVRSRPPVLLVHDEGDPVVPVAGYHEAARELKRLDFVISERLRPGFEHGIDVEGRDAGERFIRQVLGG